MAKKKKLSKEELKLENAKLRKEMDEKEAVQTSDSQRLVDSLRGKNIAAYALILVLPIVGIWWLWHKREDLKLNFPSMVVWTGIGIIILIEQIALIYQNFAH
jgi:hypothetical protein